MKLILITGTMSALSVCSFSSISKSTPDGQNINADNNVSLFKNSVNISGATVLKAFCHHVKCKNNLGVNSEGT